MHELSFAVSLNQDITEASTQTTSISVFFRSINLDGYESTYITASVKDCEEVCIQTTNCDWFFIIRPKCYLGTYKGSSDTPTIKNPIQLIEKHVYFITDKLNQLTSSKPVVDFVAENKMIKPFDRYTIIGMNMDQCKAACFFDIDTCSYYYMDADVCYIGYYYAWAGYQNFLRSELSLGVSQLHMPKQLKVTNDFDFNVMKSLFVVNTHFHSLYDYLKDSNNSHHLSHNLSRKASTPFK